MSKEDLTPQEYVFAIFKICRSYPPKDGFRLSAEWSYERFIVIYFYQYFITTE
ncbi:MAG TPA: hypothetical protein VI757_00435 [Bacteroidia bacterium]|nr:hypothetical protein [Bacteroidia bacterium]